MSFSPPPGGIYIAPSLIADRDLYQLSVSLALACGRSKTPLQEKHRKILCLGQVLTKLELDRRGVPFPSPPWHVSDYKTGPIA